MISTKKNYFYTLITSFGSMGVSSIVGLISVPIGLKYLKVEQFGIWTLVSSVLIYLAISNLGINTSASVLMAKNSKINDKMLVLSRSFKIMMLFVFLSILCFITLNVYSKNWIYAFGNISPQLFTKTHVTCLILGVFYLINMPFTLISSMLNGFQKVYVDNVFNSIIPLVTFSALLATIYAKGDIVLLAMLTGAFTFGFNVLKLGYVYFFIWRQVKYSVPQEAKLESDSENIEISSWHILKTGSRFVLIGIAAMIIWNTDNFMISRVMGVSAVVPYSVTFKLYTLMFTVIFILNNSALSLMGREFGENNWGWINKVYSNLIIITAITGGLAWIGGLYFMRDVVHLWVGDSCYPGLAVVFFLGAYAYIVSMVNLNAGLINTFNYTNNMPLISWFEALVKLGVTLVGLKIWGLLGAALGTFLGCFLSNTWILPMVLNRCSGGKLIMRKDFVFKHLVAILAPLVILGTLVQLYVASGYIRFICGVMAVLLYLFFTFKLLPSDVLEYVGGLLNSLKLKYVRISNGIA